MPRSHGQQIQRQGVNLDPDEKLLTESVEQSVVDGQEVQTESLIEEGCATEEHDGEPVVAQCYPHPSEKIVGGEEEKEAQPQEQPSEN